jgi:hypothetical protein
MYELERVVRESEVLEWAQGNRSCKITEVPHWVIMILMEDIVYSGCKLIEQIVMALHGSWGAVMQDGYLEYATEKLMTSVLLASLYEDGYIEISRGLLNDPCFFDFERELDVEIKLTASGEEAEVWEELNQLEPVFHHAALQ